MILYIGTPATIRPNIHKHAFTSYVPYIDNLIKLLKPNSVQWIVNIDIQKSLLRKELTDDEIESMFTETKNIITNIYKDMELIKFTFFTNRIGSFVNALNRITSIGCQNIQQDDLFLYLEDDWIVVSDIYKSLSTQIYAHVAQLTVSAEIGYSSIGSFSPFICNFKFFKYYCKLRLKNKKNPEKISRHNIFNDIVQNNLKLTILNIDNNSESADNTLLHNNHSSLDCKYTLLFLKYSSKNLDKPFTNNLDQYVKSYNYQNVTDPYMFNLTDINYIKFWPTIFRDIGRERNYKIYVK